MLSQSSEQTIDQATPTVKVLLAAIFLLAAILRFESLQGIQHNVDHAYPIWQAMMTLDRGVWPSIGQGTSVLFANPALTGYLFVPFVAITRSPIGAYWFVILLNTAAVWLAYRAITMLIGPRRALIAALLMAINPFLIEYSRTTWVQALIPFFTCLIFWLLVPVLLKKSTHPERRLLLVLLALTAMTETYLLAFASLVPVGLLLILFRKRIVWRAVAVGAAIFLSVTLIYVQGLANNWNETLARLNTFSSGNAQPQLDSTAWWHAVRLVSGEHYPIIHGMDAPIADSTLRENLSAAVHGAVLAALIAGIAASIYAIWKRREAEALIGLIWFFAPILLMSYKGSATPVHSFYLLLTLPAGYLLAARGAGLLLRWRGGELFLGSAAVPIAVLLSINTLRFAQNTLHLPGTYQLGALPVGMGIDMLRTLLPQEYQPSGVVVFADVDEWTFNSMAGRLFPLNRDIHTDQITYVPAGGATYLLFSKTDQKPFAPVGSTDERAYDLGDGTAIWRFRVLPISIPAFETPPVRGDRGMSLLGVKRESEKVLLLYWRVDSLPPDRGNYLFGPFVHVYDANNQRLINTGGKVVPGAMWRQGDVHIQRIRVELPAGASGPFRYEIGQFDGVHNMNMIFTLADGKPTTAIPIQP